MWNLRNPSLRAVGGLLMALTLVGTTLVAGSVTTGPRSAVAQTALCLDTAQFGQFDTNEDSVISRDELTAGGATEAEADLAANFVLNINCPNPITISPGQDAGAGAGTGETPGGNRGEANATGDGTDIGQDRSTPGATAQTPLCLDAEQFGRLDTNRDNIISPNELTAGGATQADANLAKTFILNINCENPIVLDLDQSPSAADNATPRVIGREGAIIPDPAACRVEPRTADDLVTLWYGDAGTPIAVQSTPRANTAALDDVTIPVGSPADEATIATVVTTTRALFSCIVMGDIPRTYALYTDDLARRLGPTPGTTRDDAEASLATPGPVGEGNEIIEVAEVMVLAEGRAGAFVIDRGTRETNIAYLVFEQQGDRWLVDDIIEFPPRQGGNA